MPAGFFSRIVVVEIPCTAVLNVAVTLAVCATRVARVSGDFAESVGGTADDATGVRNPLLAVFQWVAR